MFITIQGSEQWQLNLLQTAPYKIAKFAQVDDPGTGYRPEYIRWVKNDQIAFWGMDSAPKGDIYAYDIASDKLVLLAKTSRTEDDAVMPAFVFSSDAQYVAVDGNGCGGACIIKLTSGQKFNIQLKYSSPFGTSAEELIWHPTQNWLFLTFDRVGAGEKLNVSNADGTIVRDITGTGYFSSELSSFGWLLDPAKP